MSNQKKFLVLTLTIFVVISSLTISGIAMLFDGLLKLGDPDMTGLTGLSLTDSFSSVHSSNFAHCSDSANNPASFSTL